MAVFGFLCLLLFAILLIIPGVVGNWTYLLMDRRISKFFSLVLLAGVALLAIAGIYCPFMVVAI